MRLFFFFFCNVAVLHYQLHRDSHCEHSSEKPQGACWFWVSDKLKKEVEVEEKVMGLRTSNPAIHKTHTINPLQRGFMHHFTCSRYSVWCGILCYNDNIRNVEELFAQMSIWIPRGRDRFSFMPFSIHRCSHWNSLQSDMSRGRLFAPYMIASVLGAWFFCMFRCNMQKWL